MKKRFLSVVLACSLTAVSLAGCGGGGESSTTGDGGNSASGESGGETAAGPDDTSEKYSFTVYYNYTGWSKIWGQDAASQYMSCLLYTSDAADEL